MCGFPGRGFLYVPDDRVAGFVAGEFPDRALGIWKDLAQKKACEGRPNPASTRSFSLACAMSRPTTMVPFNESLVATGYLVNTFRMSAMGWSKSMRTTSPSPAAA